MSKKMSKKSHESLSVMAYNTYNVCTCNGCSCSCPDIPTHQVGVNQSSSRGGGESSHETK